MWAKHYNDQKLIGGNIWMSYNRTKLSQKLIFSMTNDVFKKFEIDLEFLFSKTSSKLLHPFSQ